MAEPEPIVSREAPESDGADAASNRAASEPAASATAGDMLSRHDLEGRYLEVTPSCRDLLGYEPHELVGRGAYEFIHPDDVVEVGRAHELLLRGETAPVVTFRVQHKQGGHRWIETLSQAVRDAEGRLLEIHADSRDVTARKLADDALRESRRLLQSVIDNTSAVVYVKDLEGRYLLINKEYEQLFGVDRRSFVGRTDRDFFSPEFAQQFRANDVRVQTEKRPIEYEENVPCAEGFRVYLSVKFPLLDDVGEVGAVAGISTDITERKRSVERLREQNLLLEEAVRSERQAHEALKRAEAQLIQAEKLSALGLMVAGIAHEVNNPLSFASNNLAVLRRDLGLLVRVLDVYREADDAIARERPDLHRRILDLAEQMDLDYTLGNLPPLLGRTVEGLGRIQRIVKDLRDFVRPDEGDISSVDLNAGLRTTASVISPRARQQGVELRLDLQPLPEVTCYPNKINQALLNLIHNAIDACAEGGLVTLRSRPGEDGGVVLEVEDTGPGIPDAIRDRIFDPFFTTKPIGQGTGLGLSIADGIVRAHGGRMSLDSGEGAGARFRIELPAGPPALGPTPWPPLLLEGHGLDPASG